MENLMRALLFVLTTSCIALSSTKANDTPVLVPALFGESSPNEEKPIELAAGSDVDCGPGLFDTLEVFVGLEGSKQPQDFGVNAHFGARLHANWGIPLVDRWGLGAQIGTAVNMTDHAVRVTSQVEGASSRNQSFTTVGLFQRSDTGWTWGIAYDYLAQDDYDSFRLSQWRGRIGYQLTPRDEVGIYGMIPQNDDRGFWGAVPVRLDAIGQGSIYWRHTWDHQAEITGWLGIAEGHGEVNAALGDANPADERVVFGSDVHVPLNDFIALFGEANFITPADTGTVDAYLGIAVYPGGRARGARRRRFAPVLPVANNTSFSVDLSR